MTDFVPAFTDEDLQPTSPKLSWGIVQGEIQRAYAHIKDLERKLEENEAETVVLAQVHEHTKKTTRRT